ncbi:MAG: hypothetical protein K8T25_00385 [Planctomycetia bacterium]|nr:hypothetical protein [Planctomycetia bacterium]
MRGKQDARAATEGTTYGKGRYAKQLAQHAALPLVEGRQLVNQIEVW